MPFISWLKKSCGGVSESDEGSDIEMTREEKLQLSLKCMQSQQSLEPIYDISGCNTPYVPDQTYTYCKLLQKTTLILSNNYISSLDEGGNISDLKSLKVLAVSSNRLSSIPNDIGYLTSLVNLDLSKNAIKSLPNSFEKLTNLQDLNLSFNEFINVPTCLCALPKLCKLLLDGNKIKKIPSEFHHLQSSLVTLSLDTEHLKDPYKSEFMECGTEGLLKHLCEAANVEYTGLGEREGTCVVDTSNTVETKLPDNVVLTSVMENYMQKKREMMRKQIDYEKEQEEHNANELNIVLKKSSDSRKLLSAHVLNNIDEDSAEYEAKKQDQLNLKIQLERQILQTHNEEMGAYLANTSNKENMIENMTAQQSQLDRDIEGLVEVKDSERRRLYNDLQSGEKNTDAVMQEILGASINKNQAFISLLQEQDYQIAHLVSTAAESAAEVRKSEVVTAMQNMLTEAMMLESKIEDRSNKLGWISSLVEDSEHSELHVKDLLSARQVNDNALAEMILHDEECQAAAFKLLLLNNDLKRSNIMRQIDQVEQELVRLSSLELRKKLLSFEYGSTTMLHQRKTLVGLLKSLLSQKSEREQQLDSWLEKMEDIHEGGREAADYWLVQYQRLLDAKPAGLVNAEEQLETSVVAVLEAARAMDVMPVFARHNITFSRLMDLDQEEAAEMGLGPVTYNSIQQALQHHLASTKLIDTCEDGRVPSAPHSEIGLDVGGDCRAASAPPLAEDGDRVPSAPPITTQPFVEAECVICLERASCVVLLPCGHVCACLLCSKPLTCCPMCRADVTSKIMLGGADVMGSE